jgi:hypothetical protein
MAMLCRLLGHAARDVHHRDHGLEFSLCTHCGVDLIRPLGGVTWFDPPGIAERDRIPPGTTTGGSVLTARTRIAYPRIRAGVRERRVVRMPAKQSLSPSTPSNRPGKS